MKLSDVTPDMRPFQPFGAAIEFLEAKNSEVLLEGPAGTGKSRVSLEKLHLCAEKYAGMRGAIVRKTRASLTQTGLVTFEEKVVPSGHPILDGPRRMNRQSYVYPNGSEIVVAGMDKAEKIMSSEYDLVYCQEAIELDEDDWEKITTRLRNGVMPYQQIIADTNPDKPTHWLHLRCLAGATRSILSRHEDNPVFYDSKLREWTDVGKTYISKLDALTGARKERLRFGRWAAAEGIIYEDWDAATHCINRFSVPPEWMRFWTIDFGFNHPFVWQHWALGPDGDLFLVHQIYKTKTIVEDHAARIKEITSDCPRPTAIICDHDAEGRATLERELGKGFVKTTPAIKTVASGLQAVMGRLRKVNGRPRIYFLRDSLDELDRELLEEGRPTKTEDEFDGYVWDTKGGKKIGEQPLKENDDGMDATRYVVAHLDLRNLPARAKSNASTGRKKLFCYV